MKIIQLAVALNDEGDESLYALTEDGQVLQRRWACQPRKRQLTDGSVSFIDGYTEGWIKVSDGFSAPVRHPEDTTGSED